MKRIIITLIIALLAMQVVSAATYSLVDEDLLPTKRVNDPIRHKNRIITRYSYEELSGMLSGGANFLRWNDGRKVCASIQIMFGKVPVTCLNLPPPKKYTVQKNTYVMPKVSKSQARVTFKIGPTYEPVKYKHGVPLTSSRPIVYYGNPRIWYPYR